MTDYSISPRDRWLKLNPDKTAEDWSELVKEGLRKKELAVLDGRVYLTEEERKRRQNERQRLCRKRRKEHYEQLEAENARLRDELAKWERLTAGIDLPEYPVVQFKPKDLERENAKLRELVGDLFLQLLNAYDRKEVDEFADRLRELGEGV